MTKPTTKPASRIGRILYALVVSISLIIIIRNLYQRRLDEELSVAVRTGSVAQVRALLNRHANIGHKLQIPVEDPHAQWYTMLALALFRLGDAEGALRRANGYLASVAAAKSVSSRSAGGSEAPRAAAGTDSDSGRKLTGPGKPKGVMLPMLMGGEAFHLDPEAMRAQREEAEAIACLLITRGAKLTPATGQPSYLMLACRSGNLAVVRCLLSKEPSVDRLDPEQSALAAALGFPRSSGAGMTNDRRGRGDRPSGGLSGYGGGRTPSVRGKVRQEMVLLLREHGAHLTAEHAVALGDRDALRSILAQGGTSDLSALLPPAVQREDLETTGILLEHGANPNLVKEGEESALCLAADRGNRAMVQLLLERGADPNCEGLDGHLPLAVACRQGHLEIAELLTAHGASVNPSGQVTMPLRSALLTQKPEMVRFLLTQGADVNQQDEMGLPLLTIALKDLPSVVPDLLHRGAMVNPRAAMEPSYLNSRGRLPTQPLMAALWYAPRYEQTLLKAGATLGSDRDLILVAAANQGRLDLLPKLLAYGANINGADIDGETALTQAIVHCPEAVSMLLEKGAAPNVVTRAQRTPLQLAALMGNPDATHLLLARHVDVNFRTPRGHTALFYARKHHATPVIALLESAGAHSDLP